MKPTCLRTYSLAHSPGAVQPPLQICRRLLDSLYDYVARGRGGKAAGINFLTGNYAPLVRRTCAAYVASSL